MSTESYQKNGVPLEALPPISLDLFLQQSGFSPTTAWRYRKKGWLRTIVIAGRHYVTREAIAEFNGRAGRGEFTGTIQNPSATQGGVHHDTNWRTKKIPSGQEVRNGVH
jgi:hypothetical protein